MTTILVTGGAGYIGTHTDVELLNKGYDVVCVDNYSNSSPKALDRVEEITGKTVKRYVYEVVNYPDTTDSYFATILVYQDAVIGGDVSAAAQNGLMQGLQYPNNA